MICAAAKTVPPGWCHFLVSAVLQQCSHDGEIKTKTTTGIPNCECQKLLLYRDSCTSFFFFFFLIHSFCLNSSIHMKDRFHHREAIKPHHNSFLLEWVEITHFQQSWQQWMTTLNKDSTAEIFWPFFGHPLNFHLRNWSCQNVLIVLSRKTTLEL